MKRQVQLRSPEASGEQQGEPIHHPGIPEYWQTVHGPDLVTPGKWWLQSISRMQVDMWWLASKQANRQLLQACFLEKASMRLLISGMRSSKRRCRLPWPSSATQLCSLSLYSLST